MRGSILLSFARAASIGCVVSACAGLISCTNHSPATAPAIAAAPAAPAPENPVIVRLESRKYSVVISAGPKSPIYTIRDVTGGWVVKNKTLDELRESRADLYDQLAPVISPSSSVMATSSRAN